MFCHSKISHSSISFDILFISPLWVGTRNAGLFPTLEPSQPILTTCPPMSCLPCDLEGESMLLSHPPYILPWRQNRYNKTILANTLPATANHPSSRPCPSPLNYSVQLWANLLSVKYHSDSPPLMLLTSPTLLTPNFHYLLASLSAPVLGTIHTWQLICHPGAQTRNLEAILVFFPSAAVLNPFANF